MNRVAANTLKVSAAAVLAWAGYEGFTSTAVIPVHGDKPTYGYGFTYKADGTPVRLGDTISRADALTLAKDKLESVYGQCVRKSLGTTPVSAVEFDTAVDFAGNYGCSRWVTSSMAREWKAGKYGPGCDAFLEYRYITATTPGKSAGWERRKDGRYQFDCATPGNKECPGVWARTIKRYKACSEQ